MWIHLKNNYIGGALHPSPNYWGCLSTSSPHPPMPMLSPPSPPLLCTLHFHTSLLLSTPLPSFTALPRPLLISSFTSLYLCTSLLLPSHSCHLLPTSPLLSLPIPSFPSPGDPVHVGWSTDPGIHDLTIYSVPTLLGVGAHTDTNIILWWWWLPDSELHTHQIINIFSEWTDTTPSCTLIHHLNSMQGYNFYITKFVLSSPYRWGMCTI